MRTDLFLHCVDARWVSGDKLQEILENVQEQWAKQVEGAPSPGMFPHSEASGTYCAHLLPAFSPPIKPHRSYLRYLRADGPPHLLRTTFFGDFLTFKASPAIVLLFMISLFYCARRNKFPRSMQRIPGTASSITNQQHYTTDAKHHRSQKSPRPRKGSAKWQQAGSEGIIDVTTIQTHGIRRLQRRTKAGAPIVQDQKSLTTPNPKRTSQSSPLSSSVTGVRCTGGWKPRYTYTTQTSLSVGTLQPALRCSLSPTCGMG